jgi:hypothetical protein
MTVQAEVAPRLVPESRTHPLLWWLALAALLAVAIWLRQVLAANTDVSWLLTVGERVLSGQRLYVDVIETNPPMAVLVYMPGIVIAHALGLPVEAVTDALVFAAIVVSLAIVARILKHSTVLQGLPGWPLALLGFAMLAILPMQSFAQREHIALIALLPMLAVMAVRANGATPSLAAIVVAGVGAGITVAFKPHFAIGLLFGIGALAIQARSWRGLFAPENFITAAVAAIYVAMVVARFPEFFTVIMPLARDVYLPVGVSALALLERPGTSLWVIATVAAWLLKRRGGIDAATLLLLSVSLGFVVVFFLQRKGWTYHSYPMLALALLALGYAMLSKAPASRHGRAIGIGGIVLLAALFSQSLLWFLAVLDARALQPTVARLGPHPAILVISGEPAFGHPLVRAVGGTWVSRQQGLWVALYVKFLRRDGPLGADRDALLDRYAAREREMLIDDIRQHPPTVLLVDNLSDDNTAWLAAHPDVAELLKDFREVETINRVTILARRE